MGGKMNVVSATVEPPTRFKILPNFGIESATKITTMPTSVRKITRRYEKSKQWSS